MFTKTCINLQNHVEKGSILAARIVVNIFYNNVKISSNKVRKDAVQILKDGNRRKLQCEHSIVICHDNSKRLVIFRILFL